MPVEKLTVSFSPELARKVRDHAGGNVSAWLADAAERKLRRLRAAELLGEYEAEAGEIGEAELEEARRAWPA